MDVDAYVFGSIVIAVTLIGAVIALITFTRAGRLLEQVGRLGPLSLEEQRDERREIIREEVRQALRDGHGPPAAGSRSGTSSGSRRQ
jgi:hypothetical protein